MARNEPPKPTGPWSVEPTNKPLADLENEPWPDSIAGADPEVLQRHKEAFLQRREWRLTLVMAEGMHEGGPCRNLITGKYSWMDTRGVVAYFVEKEKAQRASECVNALLGIDDPVGVIDEARGVLLDLATGRIERDDLRVTRIACKLGIAKEYQANEQENDW